MALEVAAAVIQRADGAFLLARRPAGKAYAGYWEFPGGKIEPGEAARAMYDLASPIHHVSAACPATLMFQGTHDAVVPLEAAQRLHRALEDAGVPVVYVEYPWTEHAFDLMYPPLANPAAKAALFDLERFLFLVAPRDDHRS